MAAATADRLDVFVRQLRNSLKHDLPVANPESDEFYESTLAEVNANGELEPLTHAAGDDDSGVVALAILGRQDDEPFTGKFQRGRGGGDPLATAHSGALIEFEIADSIGNYAIGDAVYAEDNQTVSASQSDGSAGSRPEAGTVYEVLDSTVKVYVPGLLD
jgi:hypothetical protein